MIKHAPGQRHNALPGNIIGSFICCFLFSCACGPEMEKPKSPCEKFAEMEKPKSPCENFVAGTLNYTATK